MIIDVHTHLNNYHNEEEANLSVCLENLQREMRRNRIDIALVLTSYKVVPGRPPTREVVAATRDLPNIFVVAGISYATFSLDVLAELREFLQEGSIRGLKLYPGYEPYFPSDDRIRPVYELAAEFRVPVMIHSGDTYSPRGKVKYSHPLQVDEVAVDHPEVNFVICHLGNPWIRDCMEVVYKNKNVYTDTSGLVLGGFNDRFESFMRKQFQEMLLYGVNPAKVLYGTDWPISSIESYLDFMEELKVPEPDRKKIMYQNAAELFNLEIPSQGGGDVRSLFKRLAKS
jgi:predicted TIM-barrel fold metal-dependent hydrolase